VSKPAPKGKKKKKIPDRAGQETASNGKMIYK
jgi:hypothetical protein